MAISNNPIKLCKLNSKTVKKYKTGNKMEIARTVKKKWLHGAIEGWKRQKKKKKEKKKELRERGTHLKRAAKWVFWVRCSNHCILRRGERH